MPRYYKQSNRDYEETPRDKRDAYAGDSKVQSQGFYAGHNDRRTQEMQDAGMIRENHAAIANLPQEVMIKPYPVMKSYLPEYQDDRISGIDHQINELDDKKRNDHLQPKKV